MPASTERLRKHQADLPPQLTYPKKESSIPMLCAKTPSLLLPVALSVLLTSSYSLCFFSPMITACQLIAGSSFDLMLTLFISVYII